MSLSKSNTNYSIMKLQLKNKHIFFALGDIWDVLNYKLKFQINEKVTADSDLETVQEVEFSRNDLELIISSVNNKPQGMSREINPEMFMAILPQVQALAVGGNQEAIDILTDMQVATAANDSLKNARCIVTGKQIGRAHV